MNDCSVMPEGAVRVAGGWTWAAFAERIERGGSRRVVPVAGVPEEIRAAWRAPRAALAGLSLDEPRLMGILNVTPDSFSDGGLHLAVDDALDRAREMLKDGAEIIDIGGESTRPGAGVVPEAEEIARIAPVVSGLAGDPVVMSIDTRKAGVARAALKAGAHLVNDVSAMTWDAGMAAAVASAGAPIVLMHAQGTPETMQAAPAYDDVLLDVYDALAARVAEARAAGIAADRIVVDPGIGFGKTQDHNLALLAGLSLFHGLGCPILLGASRKRFVGALSGAQDPADRVAGSLGVALAAVSQGVQILRVHDTLPTKQALTLWRASRG